MASFNVMIFSFWHLLAVILSLLYKQIARYFVYSCWFDINFKMESSGDFSLKDEQYSDRSNEVDDDQIEAIIEWDRHVTVPEIEKMLKISKSIIDHYIQRLGPVKKLDIWISHELKEILLTKRINKLNAVVKEKRPELVNREGIIFHHDNATPHTSLATRKK